MPNYTDNHELQKFQEGDEPWSHTPDMETLDVAVSLKRPRAPDENQETPKDGAMFLDTSTGDVYVGDGSSWGSPQWSLTPNSLSVTSPDIDRLFVRGSDPADEFDINDGSDIWIDTSTE